MDVSFTTPSVPRKDRFNVQKCDSCREKKVKVCKTYGDRRSHIPFVSLWTSVIRLNDFGPAKNANPVRTRISIVARI